MKPATLLPDPTTKTPVHPTELVRVESNMGWLPIWAPSASAKESSRHYQLPWVGEDAAVSVLAVQEYGQLRAFDKIVLSALMQLWHDQGRPDSGEIRFQVAEIIQLLQRNDSGYVYQQIKDSLNRLTVSSLRFQGSFKDAATGKWLSFQQHIHILDSLLLIEPKKLRGSDNVQLAFVQLTKARLNVALVRNLLQDFTRPLSLLLLQALSDRGVLFEGYINGVLHRHPVVRKDVFDLWHELGLSTTGNTYASQLAQKMKRDLKKIAADENSLLASFGFEKSKTRSKSQNLVLYRRKRVNATSVAEKIERGDELDDTDLLVERMKFELEDQSPDERNMRRIAERVPTSEIEQGIYQTRGRYRDGQVPRGKQAAYFIGLIKNRADELGIDLEMKRGRDS